MYLLGFTYSIVHVVPFPTCSSLFRTIHRETYGIREYITVQSSLNIRLFIYIV